MRIDVTTESFASAARPRHFTPYPQKIVQPLDEVIPFSCGIRDFIERGQVFGLFSKNIAVDLNILPERIIQTGASNPHQYHCATIEMEMPEVLESKGEVADKLSIYKNVNSGFYYIGSCNNEFFRVNGGALTQAEMGIEVMNWARNFATDNKCKQRPFLKTFSSKPLPDPSYATRAVQGVVTELASYWRKTLG